jgi:hypothetical protein
VTAAPNQQQTDSTVGGATHEPTPGNMVGRNVLKFLGYGFLLCFLLLLIGGPEAESVFRVLTGWIWFLASSQQQMNAPGAESGLFVGFLISAIVYGCISNFGISKCGAAGGSGWRRRIRRSAAIVGGVVLIFVAGTAFVGLTKNVIWLAKAKGSLVEGGRVAAKRSQSRSNLKQIGIALANYHDVAERFPPGGTFNHEGQGQHGWITRLLPFMDRGDLHAKIDLNDHWKSAANAQHMKTQIPSLLHPGLPWEATVVSRGFAAAHYAGNPLVLKPNGSIGFRDIKDGASNTILAGEIKDAIPAWGSAGNWRGTDRKLNSPGAFGSTSTGVVQFVLADGSVRAISENIDRTVLEALFDPADGTTPGEF